MVQAHTALAMKTIAYLLVLLAAGCGTRHWVNPDKPPEDHDADLYACGVEAKGADRANRRLLRQCMQLKGYHIER